MTLKINEKTDFEFTFKNINELTNKKPECRIQVNGNDMYTGTVRELIKFSCEARTENVIRIFFENKDGKDTIVDKNGKVIKDLNFELERLEINAMDMEHILWESKYVTKDTVIEKCLFFGPKGYFEFEFGLPLLRWWLETNHNKNNSDPTWENDLKNYETVCQKLSRIPTR